MIVPRRLAAALAILAIVAIASTAEALTLVRTDELAALVGESERAVLATVTGVRYGYDERRLHATFVTLSIEERLYGDDVPAAGSTLAIKIYGAPVKMEDGTRLFLDGTPRYSIGDRLLLLLLNDSEWGFTSATGLFQGAFRITDDGGVLFAESLGGNRGVLGEGGLSRWLDEGAASPSERPYLTATDGPVPYSLLRKAVEQLRLQGGGR